MSRKPARIATGARTIQRPDTGRTDKRRLPTLANLCAGIDMIAVQGSLDCGIADLCLDSRYVSRSALFFALPGDRMDGSYYIHDAIDRGAVAVITERSGLHHPRATFIQVADARAAMAEIAKQFYKFSVTSPALIGIAGTYGKTCVSHLLQHLLDHGKEPVGLFSSIHYDLGSRIVPSYRTTPEAIDLYGMLAQMKESGCRRAVLEISERGIAQRRLTGLPLDVAVFLNHDPDSAVSFEKVSDLFTGRLGKLPSAVALNLDDRYGEELLAQIPEEILAVTFGRNRHADVRATDIIEGDGGAIVRLVWPEGTARVRMRQLGCFAIQNLLAAVAAAHAAGVDLNVVLPNVLSFQGTPGRFEEIGEGGPFRIFVDAAKTPGSIRHALRAAREICDGRLLTVFGCAGNTSEAWRASIVQAVQEESDFSWGTAHNPGNEPLGRIFAEMREGVTDSDSLVFVDDRRRAIALALDTAGTGDVLVLLGKGNEAFQSLGDVAYPFDDRLVARELLALREVALTTI
ncbi:MAG TPA: UDP-N-acetylmuramoyl-L-alanyl-D-glutamate--2,6-diaminopimelate ligase [Opitutales bacterium]|nr:UDP-N-acetylmuramoyl-L-alanyl-D-glutamate--2,6-diaminopimelate ligase [Opitutales bacterium]